MNTKDDQRPDLLGSVTGYAAQPWSEEKPKRAGWWWWRKTLQDEPCMEQVYEYGSSSTVLKIDNPAERLGGYHDTVEEVGGWWSGPLEPPPASLVETRHIDKLSHEEGEIKP